MKYQISILIPSRNELWLSRTVQDILEHKEGATEVIIGLDGQWADPPLPVHKDVSVVYYNKSLGQRAMTNQLARLSSAKYVIKVDAHAAFDQGFDVKMWQAFKETGDNVAMFPIMKNLHVFDWVCKNGHRRYQGPSGPCKECGEPTERDVLWRPKPSPNSTAFCFDSEPHFQYFGDYKKRPEGQLDLSESMSLQGSFFMVTRDNYWKYNLCDEEYGSWGSQGLEVAMKIRTSGGKVICNHRSWYAHLFRTQGADFGFPYPNPGSKVQAAKSHAKDIFFNNKWEGQIYPLSKIIEQFQPIPGWPDSDYKKLKENEMKVERPGIYSIKNIISGKIYIGSAIDLARRFGEHLRMLHRNGHENKYLQSAWNKYGESNFTFNIELFCKPEDLLTNEQKFIDDYKNKIGWRSMYNLNPEASSSLGRKHTEESLAKMSRQQSGEGNGFYGKKHTPEAIEKMRVAHKGFIPWNTGKHLSDEVKMKLRLSHLGKSPSEETRKKLSSAGMGRKAWNVGMKLSEEEYPSFFKRRGTHLSEETKNKIGDALRGVPKTAEHNRKNSESLKGRKFSEEHRRRLSIAMKKVNTPRNNKGQFLPKPCLI